MGLPKKLILINAVVVVLFCASFVFFYAVFHTNAEDRQTELPRSLLDKPLPKSRLVDSNGAELATSDLRQGKVILVLVTAECDYCLEEGKYLGALVGARTDVRFYGVIPFGADRAVLKQAEDKFPFKLYFDEGGLLRQALKIEQVPTKIYLEDGTVRKTWIGSTAFNHKEEEFETWFSALN